MSNGPILQVDGVTKRFGGVAAVDAASLTVERGSITALIGPNGAGKTSLFNVISGFSRADRGTVRFEGKRIDRLPRHLIARSGLVRTFQSARVMRRMTVLDNMVLAGPRQPGESLWRAVTPGASRPRERELTERAETMLRSVRLWDHAAAYAGTLSGGQRKLLEFARVLMTEPRMVLLDEPMAGVNPALRDELLDRIILAREQEGITVLLIEHDLDTVMSISDTVAVMNTGRVICVDTPEAVQRNEAVVDAYLGSPHRSVTA